MLPWSLTPWVSPDFELPAEWCTSDPVHMLKVSAICVLNRYGKACRHINDRCEKKSVYSQVFRRDLAHYRAAHEETPRVSQRTADIRTFGLRSLVWLLQGRAREAHGVSLNTSSAPGHRGGLELTLPGSRLIIPENNGPQISSWRWLGSQPWTSRLTCERATGVFYSPRNSP